MLKRILRNEHYKKYFLNTGWLLGEKVVRIFASAIVGIFVARYLGPSDFGIFNYALSFTSIFLPLASLGLGDIIIREIIKNPSKENDYLGTALFLRLFSGFLVLSPLFIITVLSEENRTIILIVFIISLPLALQISDVFDKYFQARLQVKKSVQAYIFGLLLSACFKLGCLIFKAPLMYFALAQVSESLLVGLAFIHFYRKMNLRAGLHFIPALAIQYIKESWVLVLSGLMVICSIRIDQIMIKEMLGTSALGNFSAAVKLTEALYFISIAISSALYPAIIHGKTMGKEIYDQRLRRLFMLLNVISIPIALVISIISGPLIQILYGSKFTEAASVLSIHIWVGVFVFWGVVSTKWFIIEKLPYLVTINMTLCCASNVILNLILIPRYGIQGAAIATLLSQVLCNLVFLIIVKRTRGLALIIFSSLNFPRVIRQRIRKRDSN